MTKADRPLSQRPTARALRAAVARSGMTYPQIAKAIGMNPNGEQLRNWCEHTPHRFLESLGPTLEESKYGLPAPVKPRTVTRYAHGHLLEQIMTATGEGLHVGLELVAMCRGAELEVARYNRGANFERVKESGLPLVELRPEPTELGDEFAALGYDVRNEYELSEQELGELGPGSGIYVETFYELLVKRNWAFADRWEPATFGDRFRFDQPLPAWEWAETLKPAKKS